MKGKSIIGLILSIMLITGCVYISIVGIGSNKSGSVKDIKLGLDLAGGVSITYETVKSNPKKSEINDTIYKLRKRVDKYNTEAEIYSEGKNRINVDIPGVSNAGDVLKELGKPGALEFRDEKGNIVIDGSDIKNAQARNIQNETGLAEAIVQLELNKKGKDKFAKATKENIGKIIAIFYDNQPISTPRVQTAITDGSAQINGMSNFQEAENLATTIRIGALPIKLKEVRSNVVGAKLGQDAIEKSLLAGIIGLTLIILFMIVFYRIPGLAAGLALIMYVAVTIIILTIYELKITLTLPGIAGIILSIGMAVDANVIIFARIREELAQDKTIRSSIKSGFSKAMSAIVDGNITTLIAAIVLFYMGSGPIKGFAQTLMLGIVLSMFTALVVTRILLNLLFKIGIKNKKLYGMQKQIKFFDFIGKRKQWFAASIIVIVIGLSFLIINKFQIGDILNYDIDFKGGTTTLVTFNEDYTFNELGEKVKPDVAKATGDNNALLQKVEGKNQVIIKTKTLENEQRIALEKVLKDKYKVNNDSIRTDSISPTVSGEMKQKAIIAVMLAAFFMLLYITVRFKDVTFGTSAVMALIHDVLVVFTVYSVFKLPINNSFIAAMLTIVGYSINDTIVLFDRIRENKSKINMKRSDLKILINTSIKETLMRSINTSLTTFLMIFVLLLVGLSVPSLREFSLPLMVGVLSGTYSSIFIASPLWYVIKKQKA